MNLIDAMEAATKNGHCDVGLLTAKARQRGTRIRRRRRLAAGFGGAAAVVGLFGAGWVLIPSAESQSSTPVASSSAAEAEGPVSPAPVNGRTTVAALRAAVAEVSTGTFSQFGGQGEINATADETFGQLTFTPADGSGSGVVQINIQPGTHEPLTCTSSELAAGASVDSDLAGCAISVLPDGDQLRTYTETVGRHGVRSVVDLVTADGNLRVVASASNGFARAGAGWTRTRDDAVLSSEQLTAVTSQEWWGMKVPPQFIAEGEALSPYWDYDKSGGALPTRER